MMLTVVLIMTWYQRYVFACLELITNFKKAAINRAKISFCNLHDTIKKREQKQLREELLGTYEEKQNCSKPELNFTCQHHPEMTKIVIISILCYSLFDMFPYAAWWLIWQSCCLSVAQCRGLIIPGLQIQAWIMSGKVSSVKEIC